jgi:hypothetical protein
MTFFLLIFSASLFIQLEKKIITQHTMYNIDVIIDNMSKLKTIKTHRTRIAAIVV